MLKVLRATTRMQGKRDNDFCFCEGELVGLGLECDDGHVDDACGCRRSMVGLDTRTAATTFEVVEVDITPDEFVTAHRESLLRGGWFIRPDDANDLAEAAAKDADEIIRLAADFEIGSVLEKRGKYVRLREGPENDRGTGGLLT